MQICPELGNAVSLRSLLPEADIVGADDVWITGCACDSRLVRESELFAAMTGSRRDGRDFVAEAVQRGCAAVLCERAMPELMVPSCVVHNVREAFARLCQRLAGNPSRQLKLIGVTGTNGKTTTSCLIAGVLKAAGHRVGVLGTIGYLDGRVVEPSTHTTPPPERFASLLARMAYNQCSHAVMEVSSHALDQSRVAGAEFDAACVTNISQDHLDYHETLDEYRRAKSKLFDHLGPEGFAVFNADDPGSMSLINRHNGPTLTIGIDAAAEISAVPVEQYLSEQTFLLTAGSETVPVRTQMIGRHHIYNCLEAAAVGLAYGIDLATVVRGLESAGHVPGRLERIECGQPFGVFVDFAHTPAALAQVLKTLRDVTVGRLICVFGAGGERDRAKRPLMGREVERIAHVPILTNDNPRHEDPRAIFSDVLDGFVNRDVALVVPNRTAAIRRALGMAQPGDCVLIAGRGHETVQFIGDERFPLDDREVAREWLYSG